MVLETSFGILRINHKRSELLKKIPKLQSLESYVIEYYVTYDYLASLCPELTDVILAHWHHLG